MIPMHPIGHIVSEFKNSEELHKACLQGRHFDAKSRIVLRDYMKHGLKSISEFSHVWVMFHLHRAGREEMVTRPGPDSLKDLPRVGVFASRSQYRPNHIALRLVELVKVEGTTLEVRGLDAINGSPVLDIKPFIPHFDQADNPKVPEWYKWDRYGKG